MKIRLTMFCFLVSVAVRPLLVQMSTSSSDELSSSAQILRLRRPSTRPGVSNGATTVFLPSRTGPHRLSISSHEPLPSVEFVDDSSPFTSSADELLRCVAGQVVQIHCDAYGARPTPVFVWTLDDRHLLRSSSKNTKILQQSHPPMVNLTDSSLNSLPMYGSHTLHTTNTAAVSAASILPTGGWSIAEGGLRLEEAMQQLRLSPKNFGARNTLAFTPEPGHNHKELRCRVENPLLADKQTPALQHRLFLDVQCKFDNNHY